MQKYAIGGRGGVTGVNSEFLGPHCISRTAESTELKFSVPIDDWGP